jgi:hypothetical protein
MTRQVQNQQGRIINPLHTILFVSALLVFLFTVVYRMVKSESFSSAMATLVESLLIVSFFIFFGILLAYLFYFIHEGLAASNCGTCLLALPPGMSPNVNPIPIPLELNRTMKLNPSQIPEIMPVNCT